MHLLTQQRAIIWCAMVTLGSLATGVALAQKIHYPNTRRVNQIDEYHGITVRDPYRWLERMSDAEVLEWVHAQDELLKTFVEEVPVRGRLASHLLEMQQYESIWLPVRGGDRYFMQVFGAGKVSPVIYMREELDGASRELYDTAKDFDPDANPFAWMYPSPNGRYLAIIEGVGQSRWRHIRVLDVERRVLLSEDLTGYRSGVGGLAWTQDGSGFYYTRYDDPPPERIMDAVARNGAVFYHRIGMQQEADWLIFESPENPLWLFLPQVTFDNRYLVITEFSGPNTRIFVKDITVPDAEVQRLVAAGDANYSFEGNVGTRFRLKTTLNAPNGRVIELDIRNPALKSWSELIPEDQGAVLTAVGEIGGRLVLQYTKDAVPIVRVHSLGGDHLYDVDLPSIGLLAGFADDPGEVSTLYRFNSLFDPGSTYSLNVQTGKSKLFSRPKLPFDPDDFEMRQVFFHSKDGTRVPMFIAHRKDLPKSDSNPVFLYGYGAFKWTAFPWYQPHVLAWMEMGGIYAMPGIRGGGEYGESWYELGRGVNKPNSIADYIAAAEYLVEEGLTSPGKIVANGGSASGVIAASAVIERPQLFGAAVIDVPALDMLRFDLFGSGGNWGSEYGSPSNPKEFSTLISYSPYHNIKAHTCYPPILTSVGNLDDSTVPLHGYKFTAAMQYAQACENPILLKVMWGAGHAWNLGISPEQRAETGADQLAFLLRAMRPFDRTSLDDTAADTPISK